MQKLGLYDENLLKKKRFLKVNDKEKKLEAAKDLFKINIDESNDE